MSAEAWQRYLFKQKQKRAYIRAYELLQRGFRKMPIDFNDLLRRLNNES